MRWLQWPIFTVSIALQIRLIASLRHGGYRQYPVVLIYSSVLLLTSIADGAWAAGLFSLSKEESSVFFYRNEAARQFLLFIVVVSFIERTLPSSAYRMRVRVFLAAAATLAVFLSLYIHSGAATFVIWMTAVVRDVSFGSVVLTLLLWMMLISSRVKDHQLLTLTGGLGLQFTGEAIGQSFRQLAISHRNLMMVGNLIAVLTHLIRVYIWGEAFRKPRALQRREAEPEQEEKSISPPAETLFQSIV